MTFSKNGFFLGCFLFLIHVFIYELYIGDIFATLLSSLFFFYLASCIWGFAFLISILKYLENDSRFIFNGVLLGIFLFSPFVYLWVRYFRN